MTKSHAPKQVNFRLAWDVWQHLNAAAGVLGKTQGEIVTAALAVYFERLATRTRKAIDEALAVRQKP